MPTQRTVTPCDINGVVNNNADELDTAVETASIPANGTLRLTKIDGSTQDVAIPYFADAILTGLAVTQSPVPNQLDFSVAAGTYQINGIVYTIAAATPLTLANGDPVDPRIDVIYVDTTSTVLVAAGTPSASPVTPTLPAGSIALAFVAVEANAIGAVGIVTTTLVNIAGTPPALPSGTFQGQMLKYDTGTGSWVPTSNLRTTEPGTNLTFIQLQNPTADPGNTNYIGYGFSALLLSSNNGTYGIRGNGSNKAVFAAIPLGPGVTVVQLSGAAVQLGTTSINEAGIVRYFTDRLQVRDATRYRDLLPVWQTLADAANISWDVDNGENAIVTLTNISINRILNEPTNTRDGGVYVLLVRQGGSGNYTMTWPTTFDWDAFGPPVLSTTGFRTDRIVIQRRGTRYMASYQTGYLNIV
jgi:hypothetical protein